MENLKSQLKSATIKELVDLVNNVTEQIRNGRYRKPEVQHDVITVLTQRKPRVNAQTRNAYQAFISHVTGAASKNQDVMRRVRTFAKENGLQCD